MRVAHYKTDTGIDEIRLTRDIVRRLRTVRRNMLGALATRSVKPIRRFFIDALTLGGINYSDAEDRWNKIDSLDFKHPYFKSEEFIIWGFRWKDFEASQK